MIGLENPASPQFGQKSTKLEYSDLTMAVQCHDVRYCCDGRKRVQMLVKGKRLQCSHFRHGQCFPVLEIK